jgi:hypothetical protein
MNRTDSPAKLLAGPVAIRRVADVRWLHRSPYRSYPAQPMVSDLKAHARSLSWRQALAIAVGNGLEFYDFVTYAFFATQIGRTFFPSKTPGLSLLSSLSGQS